VDRIKHMWIGYAILSLVIHAAVVSLVLPQSSPVSRETIEVSLLVEDPHLQPEGSRIARMKGSPTKAKEKAIPAQSHSAPQPRPAAEQRAKTTADSGISEPTPVSRPDVASVSLASTDKSGTVAISQSAHSPGGSTVVDGTGVAGTAVASNTGGSGGVKSGGNGGTGETTTDFGGPDGPRFVHRENPEYPLYARRRKKEGKIVLLLSITEQGKLSSVEVVEASDPLFVGPTLEAIRRSTFTPAMQKGVPVAVRALLPIRFTLNNGLLQSQARSYE
jgi:periplasmic protein TonB